MARYADSLLTEGETVVLRARQHWLALFSRARNAVLLWVVGVVLLGVVVFFNVQQGLVRDVLSGIALVLIVLGLAIFIYRLWQWWAQDYIVTNRRLLKVSGILNKRSADSSLEKINDAILTQSLLGRMMNFGNLEILTAADQAVDRYYMLNSPKEFKKVMLTQKHALETGYVYGQAPTPPLRATVETTVPPPMMAPPPAPMPPTPVSREAAYDAPAAPLAAAPPSDSSLTADESAAMTGAAADPDEALEVTQTLARLADLRDQGAITAEEYEQKKDELLGRL